ncbi:putative Ty3/Gypsy polyprotein/retrotransposon, partial [Trifolium medium]|nr:putative Ty3/Gypsy polyprotein/retrotransposon [Trifolium medium]
MRHKPSIFTGGYNSDGAVKWIEEVEIIFEAMRCSEENKTTLGTHSFISGATHSFIYVDCMKRLSIPVTE